MTSSRLRAKGNDQVTCPSCRAGSIRAQSMPLWYQRAGFGVRETSDCRDTALTAIVRGRGSRVLLGDGDRVIGGMPPEGYGSRCARRLRLSASTCNTRLPDIASRPLSSTHRDAGILVRASALSWGATVSGPLSVNPHASVSRRCHGRPGPGGVTRPRTKLGEHGLWRLARRCRARSSPACCSDLTTGRSDEAEMSPPRAPPRSRSTGWCGDGRPGCFGSL